MLAFGIASKRDDAMGFNRYLPIVLVCLVYFLLNSCEQKTSDLLRSNLSKPTSSRFDTITEAPGEESPKIKKPEEKLGDAIKSGPTTASLDFLPTGPDPFPEYPPIPTDDDFFDDTIGDGPSIPYGVCGNGRVDFKEQCDDGNKDNTDGCNILCEYPVCGNGVQEKNEECDDGNTADGDGCNHRCDFERCGNKCLDFEEECDDGNLTAGDGCSPCCLFEICGNKTVDPKEECDDGNTEDGDGCSHCCMREVCGNGKTTPNEQCDDGNTVNGDGCTSTCTIEACTPTLASI